MRAAKTDQTGRMPRLNLVFAERTCHFVGFCHEAADIFIHCSSTMAVLFNEDIGALQ